MWNQISKPRLVMLFALLALAGVSAHTSFDGNKSGQAPIEDAFATMGIYVSPLIIVAVALVSAEKQNRALIASWMALLVGGLVEFGYYNSHDHSKVMLLAISTLAYWVSAAISLSAYSKSTP